MKKPLDKIIFGDLKGEAKISFDKKLETLKTKYKKFLETNDLDFEMIYNFQMSDYYVEFNIENQSVSESDLGKEMRKAFSESFSELFIKD
jgi:hypothetical protein